MKSIRIKELLVGDLFSVKMTLYNRESLIVMEIDEKAIKCVNKNTGAEKNITIKGSGSCFLLKRD